jgi:hypothetical protein
MELVNPSCVAHWKSDVKVAAETVTVMWKRGVPVALYGKRYESLVSLLLEANQIGAFELHDLNVSHNGALRLHYADALERAPGGDSIKHLLDEERASRATTQAVSA